MFFAAGRAADRPDTSLCENLAVWQIPLTNPTGERPLFKYFQNNFSIGGWSDRKQTIYHLLKRIAVLLRECSAPGISPQALPRSAPWAISAGYFSHLTGMKLSRYIYKKGAMKKSLHFSFVNFLSICSVTFSENSFNKKVPLLTRLWERKKFSLFTKSSKKIYKVGYPPRWRLW